MPEPFSDFLTQLFSQFQTIPGQGSVPVPNPDIPLMPDATVAASPGPTPGAPMPVVPPAFEPGPGGIPMPRPRPDDTPPQPQEMGAGPFAAPGKLQAALRTFMPQASGASALEDAMTDGGGMGSAAMLPGVTPGGPSSGFARAMAALAGLSQIKGNGPLASLARGFGVGQAAANAYDTSDLDRRLKTLDRAINLRKAGDTDAYRNAYLDILRQRADTGQQKVDISGSAPRPQAKTIIESERLIAGKTKGAEAAIAAIRNDYRLTPEQKTAQIAKIQADRDEYVRSLRRRLGLGDETVAARPGQRAGKPGEIAMPGNGTRETPYQPKTASDYADIPAGAFYVHPATGQVRLKSDAAPPPPQSAPGVDADEEE